MPSFTGKSLSFVLFILILAFVGAILFWNVQASSIIPMDSQEKSSPDEFTVLSANLGNSDYQCYRYKKRLCRTKVEQRIAENLRDLNPDIVAFQELLPPWLCDSKKETNIKKVCSESQTEHQARRLLGPDYTIVCEPRKQYECIAVHTRAGEIVGCPAGELCLSARSLDPPDSCRDEFAISAVTVNLNNGAKFDVVNVHPPGTHTTCRNKFLARTFDPSNIDNPIILSENVLAMGDFNFDPWRDGGRTKPIWTEIMTNGWAGRPMEYLSGSAEKVPPYHTLIYVIKKTFDFAVSNFASGTLQVLGKSPGTSRLDGGEGTDHRAIFGKLILPPE